MSSPPGEVAADRREVHLRLGPERARTRTSLTMGGPRRALDLIPAFDALEVTADGVGGCHVEAGGVRLRDLRAGARVTVSGEIEYRPTPHGLHAWTDAADGSRYVVASGALGGATHFMACDEGPADRMVTRIVVESGGLTRSWDQEGTLASHQLGLAAGPWLTTTAPGAELLARRALGQDAHVRSLLADTGRVLTWLLDWFDAAVPGGPWGPTYTQVLLPRTPWLAMEYPGCVLLSERLLGAPRARRVAVLAHEAAHQWLGNLVSPRSWCDVGLFEGLAELLGQLACEAIMGREATGYLKRRRSAGPLALPPIGPDLRTLPTTAGLAEVAGPVQHAELLRAVREQLGGPAFRDRVGDLVRRRAGTACSAADVWGDLGQTPRTPRSMRLPTLSKAVSHRDWPGADILTETDPAAAAAAARHAFRACSSGGRRVRAALAVIADPATPSAVTAGLAAELARRRIH